MIVTGAELAGLSAISGGGALPGVEFTPDGEQQAVVALQGLQGKGVVNGQGCVTRFGMVPVRVVQQYRDADRHVFVNALKASLNDDGAVSVFQPAEGGWHIARVQPAALLISLLQAFPWLCGSDDIEAGPSMTLSMGQWAVARQQSDASQIMVVRDTCRSAGAAGMVAFDMVDGHGYVFDMMARTGQVLPIRQVRTRVARLLGCSGGVGDG